MLSVNISESFGDLAKTIYIIFILYYTVILFCTNKLIQQSCHSTRRTKERMIYLVKVKKKLLSSLFTLFMLKLFL